jgi:predicted DNA-binding mobile mystery protein A
MSFRINLLQLKQLDKHIIQTSLTERPSGGWVRAIRNALGMSTKQLAKRMRVSQQAVSQLENKELDDSVTIKTLRKAAEAMNCKLVYSFIPQSGSLEGIVKNQAVAKATDLISAVDHTMQLEAQGVGNMQDKIMEMAEELAKNPNSKLWE